MLAAVESGDLPPRRECALRWRSPVLAGLPDLRLVLVIGRYARDFHLPEWRGGGLTGTVMAWRQILSTPRVPRVLPLPHPSWRNNGWLRRNPWFEEELLPALRTEVERVLGGR